jgi:formylglycine-generating enzyme required for sulfatase activity
LLDEEELDSKWEKLRREYVGCGVPYLYQSFKAENPPRIDKLVILSLHRKLLFTQGEISIEGKGFTISGFSLEMLWCPSGTFEMGSPKGIFSGESGRQSNEVQHEVTLTQGFWLGKYPVTQTQWKAVMGSEFPLGGANPSNHKGADRPVEQVSWIDVTAFCEKLTGLESNAGRLPAGMSYQLPTEAQWEYACRAGTNTAYAFGDSLTEEQANISGGPEETTSVGSYKPNAWGFYDMHGNVWEWCEDWHGPYQSSPAHDPVGPKGSNTRITRGGAWNIHGWGARSANRSWDLPWVTRDCLGFRLSLGLKPTER